MVQLIGHRRRTTTAHLIAGMPKQVLTGSSNRTLSWAPVLAGGQAPEPTSGRLAVSDSEKQGHRMIAQHNESPRPDNPTAG